MARAVGTPSSPGSGPRIRVEAAREVHDRARSPPPGVASGAGAARAGAAPGAAAPARRGSRGARGRARARSRPSAAAPPARPPRAPRARRPPPEAARASPATMPKCASRPAPRLPDAGRCAAALQLLDQRAGVDLHRAGGLAHGVAGAGLDAFVVEVRAQRVGPSRPPGRPVAASRASSRVTTMRWRGVRVRSRDGQRGSQNPHSMHLSASGEIGGSVFRSLRWHLGIVVQHHAGVQDAVGIEQGLDPLHDLVGALAPLVAHERRHVAARAVLGLERAVVLAHHHLDELAHEARRSGDGRGAAKSSANTKCRLPSRAWPKDRVLGKPCSREQGLAVGDGLGQPRHRHRDVLDHDRRPGRPHAAHRGKRPLRRCQVPRAPRRRS